MKKNNPVFDVLNGFILINKDRGMTSFQATQRVRKILRVKKAGHTGTLDPMATGLLIICVGKGTKQVSSFMDMEKEYRGKMIFGLETNTQDMDGDIIASKDASGLTLETLKELEEKYTGEIEQIPPHFSAVHHEGRRLYEWAREGKQIDLPPRKVEMKKLEIISLEKTERGMEVEFVLVCGKGMYVRALARDMGADVGTGAVVSKLTRSRVGEYSLENALSIAELLYRKKEGPLSKLIHTLKPQGPRR